LNDRTVWLHIEQEVCQVCRQGLTDPQTAAGVLRQVSTRYSSITFVVTNERTSEVVRVRAGRAL
jgi:hypothetical protein